MININKLANAMASQMAEAAGYNEKTDELRFGLEIILGAIIKGVVLFFLAYLLNVLPHVAAALVTGGLFRMLSGGAHCTSYGRCLVMGVIMYLLIGRTAFALAQFITPDMLVALTCIVTLIAAVCTIKRAPGETTHRPMNEHREKHRFKVLSLLYLTLWLGLLFYLMNKVDHAILLASILALVLQTLSFTPLGYGFIARADEMMARFTFTNKGGDAGAPD